MVKKKGLVYAVYYSGLRQVCRGVGLTHYPITMIVIEMSGAMVYSRYLINRKNSAEQNFESWEV